MDTAENDDNAELPTVVVYLVDSFSNTATQETNPARAEHTRRLAMIGLLRCYQSMLGALDNAKHVNIQLQIIPYQQMVQAYCEESPGLLKSLAMAVYTQCREVMKQHVPGKSMTGFGPAAQAVQLLNKPTEVLGGYSYSCHLTTHDNNCKMTQ